MVVSVTKLYQTEYVDTAPLTALQFFTTSLGDTFRAELFQLPLPLRLDLLSFLGTHVHGDAAFSLSNMEWKYW